MSPMVPMLAQGAVMAIEDGMVLARCFDALGSDVEGALSRYEDLRRDRFDRFEIDPTLRVGRGPHADPGHVAAVQALFGVCRGFESALLVSVRE